MEGESIRLSHALELVRPLNCVFTGVAVIIGIVVTAGRLDMPLNLPILAFAAAALVAAGGNAVNDYFDRDIDRINRPERPIPSGQITQKEALTATRLLFVLGIVLAALLNIYCVLLAAVNSIVLTLYSWGLKKRGLVGNLAIGYLVGSSLLFGGLAISAGVSGPLIPGKLLTLVLMAGLSTVGRELIKAVQDMEGDKKLGFRTFPLVHGAGKSAALAVVFIGAAIAVTPIPYLLNFFGWQYLALVAVSVATFIAAAAIISMGRDAAAAKRASLACKLGMGLGLLAFLVGALANLV